MNLPVLEEHEAQQQPEPAAGQVRRVAGAAALPGQAGDHVDHEDAGHDQEAADPHHPAEGGGGGAPVAEPLPQDQVVLPPVEEEGGEVRRAEGVHPRRAAHQGAAGPDQGVGEGGGQDGGGVEQGDPGPAVGHLQGQGHEEEEEQVDGEVLGAWWARL